MDKRGQITVFVILGIVIVAIIVLLFAFRKDIIPTSSQTGINSEMKAAKQMITDCLEKSATAPVEKIAMQGGYLSPAPSTFRLWNDTQISYLCFNQADKVTSTNRLLTLRKMEDQLSAAVEESLKTCVDLTDIKGVDIIAQKDFKVTTRILPYQVLFDLDYPITVQSKVSDAKATEKKFSFIMDAPLGDLYDAAQDILDQETEIGTFDQLTYMLVKLGKHTIYVVKPYPDKIYRLKLRENPFMFQFAVQGEPS
ncbi:MAG: hypothetical protein AABY09_04800 [Nanoarchaeota archaeon]